LYLGKDGGVGGLPPLFDVVNVYFFLEFVEFFTVREGVVVVVHIHVSCYVNEVEAHGDYLFELALAAAVSFFTCGAWTAEAEDFGRSAVLGDRPDISTPVLCRSYDGIPNGVDRIKGLGNAIVPQVAFEIFQAIDKLSNEHYA